LQVFSCAILIFRLLGVAQALPKRITPRGMSVSLKLEDLEDLQLEVDVRDAYD
jgi:hypothetical protein